MLTLRSTVASSLFALCALSAACGGSSKPSNTIPEAQLAPDQTPAPAEPPPAPAPAAEPPPAPAPPAGPLQISIEASSATVKLLSPGKGARARLRLSPKAASKQQVDLVMEAVITQTPAGKPAEVVTMPTVVLAGTGEVTAVDKDGVAIYHAVIDAVDARDRPNQTIPASEMKPRLSSLTGMKIDGSVSATGATGATTYVIEQPQESTAGAIDSLKLMLPTWLPLPAEPVGNGAQWEVTAPVLFNGIETTQVTTYKLVARTAKSITISGETKVSGQDQAINGVQIKQISGGGKVEATFEVGKLYPKLKRTVSTTIHLQQGGEDVAIDMQVGSAFEPK
jgi:hypothetical protein